MSTPDGIRIWTCYRLWANTVPVMQQSTAQVHTSTSQTTANATSKTTVPVPVPVNVEPPKTTVAINAPSKPTTVNNVTTPIPRKTLTLAELRVHHAKYGHISIDATIAILRTQNISISDTLKGSFFCIDCAPNQRATRNQHILLEHKHSDLKKASLFTQTPLARSPRQH